MVDWLAGKRVRGTSSERTPLGVTLGGTGVGGWVELGRTTLGGASSTINVSSLPNKRYYMFLYNEISIGANAEVRLGSGSTIDTGSNYAGRLSRNGGADSTSTSSSAGIRINDNNTGTPNFAVGYIANYATKEKLLISHNVQQNTAGASNAPGHRLESVGKWANTSNALDIFQINSSSLVSGDEVVILGWDPADTHTNNFWQELASVDWTSGNTIDTGTFTAKKYLWVQMSYQSSASHWSFINFNSDNSATKYAGRTSINGGADGIINPYSASEQYYQVLGEGSSAIYANNFVNMFIINNASNEKLGIVHSYQIKSTELGAGSTGSRFESVIKYAETTNPITQIELIHNTNDFEGGTIKVWGSD